MSGWVVALILSTAILHASWNAVLRHGRDGLWTFTLIMAGATALSALCLPFLPLPDRSCVPFLAAAFLLHGIYSVLLIFGYRWGELGAVYPIARGTAPLLVSAGAALFADERLSLPTLAAIAVVSLGIVGLSRDHLASAAPPRALASPRGLRSRATPWSTAWARAWPGTRPLTRSGLPCSISCPGRWYCWRGAAPCAAAAPLRAMAGARSPAAPSRSSVMRSSSGP
jgi:multidrug transporter EmrE-like cation transporter